ncbi:MAG: hypothetical protein DRI61_14505 [Chloroflexi bacterium]|nr:MAG: hypothetical protein DRI61_14505 [Chloroflexota bacterium]
MKNVFKKNYEEDRPIEERRPLHESDIPVGLIKQRHIGDKSVLIKRGLSADIPDGNSHVMAYFETDTNKLKIWNGSSWVGVTLS